MNTKKKCVLLGATGSIGESTLRVLRKHADKIELIGISANQKANRLLEITNEFNVAYAHIGEIKEDYPAFPQKPQLGSGPEELEALASLPEADIVVVAIVGAAGLGPTLAAAKAGKTIVLANKESLVVGGELVTKVAKESGAKIIPADSEHNAIHQCLHGQDENSLNSIVLTASGGAFRDLPLEMLKTVTLEQALKHPNWSMGPKVTIDSATMANKGLELIEAHWLFDLSVDQMDVMIHPPSIVHAIVRFVDGCCFAQLSPPSMTFAIQNALLYPQRIEGVEQTLDFSKNLELSFYPPCTKRYPCLKLARTCLEQGGAYPLFFNAANEIAVEAFRTNRIGFVQISDIIDRTLNKMEFTKPTSIYELHDLDKISRITAEKIVNQLSS